ncbi:DUF2800 domain-containing protein [Clostridium pasteurianum]|uniref:DUF2800 domain-containing protein n=1 Tax=Clostridium pasteurianum BC1 TaxID=86416 RepID=R4JXS4_CLOPA|nr:DUF2800 domain-containing protein [Clostridium pasteurianum]AGK95607.1 Protein of unknown function (DUF2800) [Clostridium pasteurianum BC1]
MIKKNETRAHALLSASSAHRWLICTPSARLEETLPDSTSENAKEGTLAHAIAELKLRKYIEPMGPRTFNNRIKKFKEDPLFQDEMLRHTDTYMDYISEVTYSFSSPPYIAAEKKLDYSVYAPEGFGTGDCIIIGGNTLHVIDFKYGKGVPVSAESNPQMMLYALGAYEEEKILFNIQQVKMTIIQPRLDSISEFSIPIKQLLDWGESIRPIAEKAFNGVGDYIPGDHCQFCRAKAICRAAKDKNLSVEVYENKMPPLLTNEEVGQILEKAKSIKSWVTALEKYALGEVLKGNDISGWKAVHGRSVRQFINTDEAFKVLKDNGTDEAMLYDKVPLSLAKIEELIGKPKFKELLSDKVSSPPGKPTLAPLSDNREPIKKVSAADVFKNEGGVINE